MSVAEEEEDRTPHCATEGCTDTPKVMLSWSGTPIAYACSAPHLVQVMYATRHLNGRMVQGIRMVPFG